GEPSLQVITPSKRITPAAQRWLAPTSHTFHPSCVAKNVPTPSAVSTVAARSLRLRIIVFSSFGMSPSLLCPLVMRLPPRHSQLSSSLGSSHQKVGVSSAISRSRSGLTTDPELRSTNYTHEDVSVGARSQRPRDRHRPMQGIGPPCSTGASTSPTSSRHESRNPLSGPVH